MSYPKMTLHANPVTSPAITTKVIRRTAGRLADSSSQNIHAGRGTSCLWAPLRWRVIGACTCIRDAGLRTGGTPLTAALRPVAGTCPYTMVHGFEGIVWQRRHL